MKPTTLVLVYFTGNSINLVVTEEIAHDVMEMYIAFLKKEKNASEHLILVDDKGEPKTMVMFSALATLVIDDGRFERP